MQAFEYVATPSEFARAHLFHALLCGYDQPSSAFYFERRRYPAYELLLITKGKGWFMHAGREIELVQGDCLIHDMRYPHAYRSNPDDPYEMYFLVFDGLDIDPLWKRFFSSPYAVISINLVNCPLEETFLNIKQLLRDESAIDEIAVSSSVYLLLVQFFQIFAGNKGGGGAKQQSIAAAKSFIDSHFTEIEQIKDIAVHANLSLYHFIRQFKKQYGLTPKEYLLSKRIHYAKRLLLITDLAVGEIAERSGFPNYNSFLHSFIKIEQLSPTSYRKNWKKRPF
jgi:AraC family transcriptional regulator